MNFLVNLVLAQPASEPGTDMVGWALGLVKWIAEQFAAKNYVGAVAAIVMALVFVAKLLLKDKLSSGALPLLSAGLGLLAAVAADLMSAGTGVTGLSVVNILVAGVTTGAMASGFWSLLGKHIVDWTKAATDKALAKKAAEKAEEEKKEDPSA